MGGGMGTLVEMRDVVDARIVLRCFPLVVPLALSADGYCQPCQTSLAGQGPPSYWLNLSVAESALIFCKEFRSAILKEKRKRRASSD